MNDDRLARWVYDTCRLFGASPTLASEVQAIFMRGVREQRAERDVVEGVRQALNASGEVRS